MPDFSIIFICTRYTYKYIHIYLLFASFIFWNKNQFERIKNSYIKHIGLIQLAPMYLLSIIYLNLEQN